MLLTLIDNDFILRLTANYHFSFLPLKIEKFLNT